MRLIARRWTAVLLALLVGLAAGALGTALVSGGRSARTAATRAVAGASGGSASMMAARSERPDASGASPSGEMPGAMMGGGSQIPRGASGGFVAAAHMQALAAAASRTTAHHGSSLAYSGNQVTLVALGAPGNRPGMYWQIDGVDNAAVSVPAGASITVEFADGDPGHPHGLELTTAAPPYPRMAMMDGRIAAVGGFIMPVPAPEGSRWYAATTTFHAPAPGTYYIICPVPGHAQNGMWAKFVVR